MIRLVCEDGPGNESAMVLGPWECPYTILGSVPSPQWLSKCDVAVGADPVSRSDSVHDSCSALCYGATVLQCYSSAIVLGGPWVSSRRDAASRLN